MFKPILLAGLAAAAFIPSLASAQNQCQDGRGDNRLVGTVLGAGVGALLGNAIGEHGGKTGGTIIGGVGGAVVGNQLAGANNRNNCQSNRYGYYDGSGRWMPNTATAYGYYDANGRWVDGAQTSRDYRGDSQRYYAPQSGYASAPPPTEYNNGGDYRQHQAWADGSQDMYGREASLEQDIRRRMADGSLDRGEGRRALRELRDIRREDANARNDDNQLPYDQQAQLERRLDDLSNRVGVDRHADAYRPQSY